MQACMTTVVKWLQCSTSPKVVAWPIMETPNVTEQPINPAQPVDPAVTIQPVDPTVTEQPAVMAQPPIFFPAAPITKDQVKAVYPSEDPLFDESVICDILRIVNDGYRYPPRGDTEEYRIPEDISTGVVKRHFGVDAYELSSKPTTPCTTRRTFPSMEETTPPPTQQTDIQDLLRSWKPKEPLLFKPVGTNGTRISDDLYGIKKQRSADDLYSIKQKDAVPNEAMQHYECLQEELSHCEEFDLSGLSLCNILIIDKDNISRPIEALKGRLVCQMQPAHIMTTLLKRADRNSPTLYVVTTAMLSPYTLRCAETVLRSTNHHLLLTTECCQSISVPFQQQFNYILIAWTENLSAQETIHKVYFKELGVDRFKTMFTKYAKEQGGYLVVKPGQQGINGQHPPYYYL